MAVSKLDILDKFLDDNGALLANGWVYTYIAGTSTALATYADNGATPAANTNPVQLDSSGVAALWFTKGAAYKIIIKTSAFVTIDGGTIDNIEIPDTSSATLTGSYILDFLYHGNAPPVADEFLGAHHFTQAVDFPANLTGSFGGVLTAGIPTSSFVLRLRKNAPSVATGSTFATITYAATTGLVTFATTSGTAQSCAISDYLTLWGPNTPDTTANDFWSTLIGTLA